MKPKEDEFGRHIVIPVLTDEFRIGQNDPFQWPDGREESGLAEAYILDFRYFSKKFSVGDLKPLLIYVYQIQPIRAKMIDEYKEIVKRREENNKSKKE